jgi:hypothetical protein
MRKRAHATHEVYCRNPFVLNALEILRRFAIENAGRSMYRNVQENHTVPEPENYGRFTFSTCPESLE